MQCTMHGAITGINGDGEAPIYCLRRIAAVAVDGSKYGRRAEARRSGQMRQTATVEMRFDEGKAASSGATRPSDSPFWAPTGRLRPKFRCGTPR